LGKLQRLLCNRRLRVHNLKLAEGSTWRPVTATHPGRRVEWPTSVITGCSMALLGYSGHARRLGGDAG
jgi:hypothetical protein